jgi:hypothetical protein
MDDVESVFPFPGSWKLEIGVVLAKIKRDRGSILSGEECFVNVGAVKRPVVIWKDLGELVEPGS